MKKVTAKQVIDKDQKIIKPDTFLETEKGHKDWYQEGGLGKRPIQNRIPKKEKGSHSHSLRKHRLDGEK